MLNYSEIQMYSRNKNIHIETIDRTTIAEKILKRVLRLIEEKSSKRGHAVFSDRIVEYPLLFSYLDPGVKTILDFGCVEDLLPMHLCSLGYKVTGLDFRPYPFSHPNFDFIQADILTWQPPENQFDAVISISTVEHVGLGGYGDPIREDGDKVAVQKLISACHGGGRLYLTVPAGRPCTERNMRIYDARRLQELIPNIQVMRFFSKPSRYGSWQETTAEEIAGLVYDDYYTISPGQGVAFVVATKR